MDLLIIVALTLCNSFLALSEMSLAASKKTRLASMAADGDHRAKLALSLADDPNRVLATTQIGLTFITMVQGALGDSSFTAPILAQLPHWSWMEAYRDKIALGVALSGITFFSLIVGEMLPKRVALLYPETIARAVAPTASRLIGALSPAIGALSWITNRLMAAMGLPLVKSEAVSAEDVETMLEAAGAQGLLSEREKTIMDNVWRLDERKVGAIMTPRANIAHIDISNPHESNLDVLASHPRARLVVTQGGLDHVLGMAPAKTWTVELMRQLREKRPNPTIDWTSGLTPAHAVPNSLTLIETLESFRAHKAHSALVYNEFGQVEGLVTMSDLMDAVVGEVPLADDHSQLIFKDPAGRWLIDGLAPLSDLRSALELEELPGEDQAHFQTAGGFALWMIGRSKGRLPKEFDEFEHSGLTFQVVDIDRKNGYRIDQLMVVKTPPASR